MRDMRTAPVCCGDVFLSVSGVNIGETTDGQIAV